jgi:hypothetical protein
MGAADMTKESCIYGFISGFGPAAYEASAVPTGGDAPAFPYTTYSLPIGAFGEELSMTVSLWYRSYSWAEALAKADEISRRIGRSGVMLPCDGGGIWIRRGVPFAQTMGDPADDMIKRVYINLTVEYITND